MGPRGLFTDNPFLRQGVPVLLLTAAGGILTGTVLQGMVAVLQRLPGLIVLVPALIAIRGNIKSALGSRLGSAAHLGLIEPGTLWNAEIRENVVASMILAVLLSGFAAVLAWAASRSLGLPTASLGTLFTIAVTSGLVAGALLTVVVLLIMAAAHRYGLDPDNVTGPLLATVGDVITLIILYAVAVAVLGGSA